MTSDVRNAPIGDAGGGVTNPPWTWPALSQAVSAKRIQIVQATPSGAVLEEQAAAMVRRLAELGHVVAKRSQPLEDAVREWEALADSGVRARAAGEE